MRQLNLWCLMFAFGFLAAQTSSVKAEYMDGMSQYRGYMNLTFADPSGMHVEQTGQHDPEGRPIWHDLHTGKCFVRIPKKGGPVLGAIVEVPCPTIPQSGGVTLSPSNCCKRAKQKGFDLGGRRAGLVICCGDTKVPCVWTSAGTRGSDPTAVRIIDTAVLAHEKCHLAHTKPCVDKGCDIKPAEFDYFTSKEKGECECYKEQYRALRYLIGYCKQNVTCNEEVWDEIDRVTKALDKFCSDGWEKDVLGKGWR